MKKKKTIEDLRIFMNPTQQSLMFEQTNNKTSL